MTKQLYFKQFTLAWLRCLRVKTFLFQAIQFSIITQLNFKIVLFPAIQFSKCIPFITIWPIDRNLLGATIPGLSEPGAMVIKEYSAFPKAPALLKPHSQFVSSHIYYRVVGRRALLLCRVCVLFSPSRLCYGTLVRESLTPLQRCSWCILQPQLTRPLGTCWMESYSSAEMQLVYSTASADWTRELERIWI